MSIRGLQNRHFAIPVGGSYRIDMWKVNVLIAATLHGAMNVTRAVESILNLER